MRVLSARGSELGQEFSYGAVRQLFEPLLAAATPEEHAAAVSGAAELTMPIFDPPTWTGMRKRFRRRRCSTGCSG